MKRQVITPPPLRLDDLPMFASDRELAEAIVGRDKAEKWMAERLPTIASKPGFPQIDEFHGGRPVRLVAKFYEQYLGETEKTRGSVAGARGKENPEAWKPSKHRA